jgi:UDP-N-acetyl-D-glucosamine dehydrogenase
VKSELEQRIATRRAVVGVIGLGYVGLPVAVHFGRRGFGVLGFDVDPRKVRAIRASRSYIDAVSSRDLKRSGMRATADFGRLREVDAVLICVPTPLAPDGSPDLSFVRRSARAVARTLRAGQLVVLESTTYPGTTRRVVKPILDRAGVPYLLGYAPERIDPGNRRFGIANTPRLVSGIDAAGARAVAALYRAAIGRVVPVSAPEVAEAAKLLENIYRAVNIAMINELKTVLDKMKIDVWEVIAAAASKPFGFAPFTPGPGMGGHCIPVDPFYLSWKARRVGARARFIELAGRVNRQMPRYVVGKLEEALRARGRRLDGARVLVLGVAYKRDTDDTRESPGLEIMALLRKRGCRVAYSDPHVPRLRPMRRFDYRLASVRLTPATLRRFDAAVLATDHAAFDRLLIARHARLVVDTRRAFGPDLCCAGNIVRA